MANDTVREYESELNQTRPRSVKVKTKKSPETPGSSLLRMLIPLAGEMSPIGILPFWTGFVINTYRKEKKSGKSPNLAEYFVVGGMASAVDIVDILDLTGFGMIIGRMIDIPAGIVLWMWRAKKEGLKTTMSAKKA